MSRRCDCCGQTLPPDELDHEVHLTPMQRKIADTVFLAGPNGIVAKDLLRAIYDDGGEGKMSSLKVLVCLVRKRLAKVGRGITKPHYHGPYVYVQRA